MGIGFVLAVPADEAAAVIKYANETGENAYPLGEVAACAEGEAQIEII
jgi:phosphoribosylaminoimidazole (AIR) synthetase